MPLYEYQCRACAHRFERIQKFSDLPIGECPSCGGAVEKLVSSPAIQFKGSGWYINDYAKPGKTGSDKSSSTASTGDPSPAKSDKTDKTETKTSAEPSTSKPAGSTTDPK